MIGATFHGLANKTRFKLKTRDPLLKSLVCIKVDHQRFAELDYNEHELSDEVVRVCYGDFEVIVVEPMITPFNVQERNDSNQGYLRSLS